MGMPETPWRTREERPAFLSRDRALALALVAATALAAYLCYLLVRPFLPALAWALALAVVAYPLHRAICKRIPLANVAALLTVAAVVVAIVLPAVFVSRQFVKQATVAAEMAAEEVSSGRWRAIFERSARLAPLARRVEEALEPRDVAARAVKALQERAGSLVSGTVWTAIQLLVTVFCLFYFFRDRRVTVGALRSLVPLSDAEMQVVAARVVDTIRATIFGSVTVAAVQGLLGGLMFWVLGLPAPLLWGTVMALLAIVPMLGAFLVWIPAAIYLAVSGDWLRAVILAAWGATAVSFIDNLLYPVLVGSRLRLHTLPVFFSIVGGITVFGAAGVILGPVVLAVSMALVEVWRWRTAHGRPGEIPVEHPAPLAGRLQGQEARRPS